MGAALFYGSGLVMLGYELWWFHEWWGVGGVAASLLIPPLVAIFPFIVLVKEGFSAFYFGVWALGLLGAWMMSQRDTTYA